VVPVQTVEVRPYEPADRAAVREICFLTGYLGEPVDWLWPDRESFADMFASGVDVEPSSAYVALARGAGVPLPGAAPAPPGAGGVPSGGAGVPSGTGGVPSARVHGPAERPSSGTAASSQVVGYLLGFVDARREPDPALVAARHALRRGLLLRPGMARVLRRAVRDLVTDGVRSGRLPRPIVDHDRHPACLHVDLLPEARGQGVGRRLVAGFLDRLASLGVPGCHLVTFAENTGAIAFFSSLGFERLGEPVPAPGFRTRAGERMHLQVMARTVTPSGPAPPSAGVTPPAPDGTAASEAQPHRQEEGHP
jgi:ribosomal protein S18 acetylase RimI-like enzyme